MAQTEGRRAGTAAGGSVQSGRGRPRDPDLDARVLAAALAEYARTGWAGFTMHGVAGRAGVGKSSLYLRWPTKEKLLIDAIEAHTRPLVADPDTGSLLGDTLAIAVVLLDHFLDPIGWVTLRIAVDAAVEAVDLAQFHERLTQTYSQAVRRVFDRALARGELPPRTDPRPLLDGLFGGVLMHALSMPPREHEQARSRLTEHVSPLVHLLLAGAVAVVPTAAA